jgi:NADPH:quinone reductase-like Zn-dependent oxidoreductase
MEDIMKAFELPAPAGLDSWTLVDRDCPRPGRGQVLVKMCAASLNYRDILVVTGRSGSGASPKNLVPVSDGAGQVVEVGAGVTRVAPGDRVAGIFVQTWLGGAQPADARNNALGGSIDGVLAEYRVFEENGLVKVPDHLSFEEAATLPCAAVTAWNALYGLKSLQPGQTVLTLGTGGVSTFAMQFAHAAGARVICTSSSDAKLAKARSLGATDSINYTTHPDWDAEVRALTGGRGVDCVIEVGGAGTLLRSIKSTVPGGVVTLIGRLSAGSSVDPMTILGASCIVRGVFVGSRELFEAMNRAVAFHQIHPVIDHVFDFDTAKEALAYLHSGSHVGKVVIRIV